jgi:hypothetical protein
MAVLAGLAVLVGPLQAVATPPLDPRPSRDRLRLLTDEQGNPLALRPPRWSPHPLSDPNTTQGRPLLNPFDFSAAPATLKGTPYEVYRELPPAVTVGLGVAALATTFALMLSRGFEADRGGVTSVAGRTLQLGPGNGPAPQPQRHHVVPKP